MDRESVVCIYTMEYHSAIKKEWNVAICKNMDRFRWCNAKWSKSEKDKYLMISLILDLWNKTNKQRIKRQKKKPQKTQTLKHREQADGCQRGGWWGDG